MAKINHVKNKVKLGDTILFSRKGMLVEGIVTIVNENSVIANISYEDSQVLNYSTTTTVIGHKNIRFSLAWLEEGLFRLLKFENTFS
jgi:uncharacterized protein YkvS